MDRLRVSLSTFTRIVDHHRVFPYFLQAVPDFKLRSRSDTSTWNNFHLRQSDGAVEACYTIRYVENNGRASGDAWSFRKTAVYQRYDVGTNSSTWILIKVPDELKKRLAGRLEALWLQEQLRPVRHLAIHSLILAHFLQGWRDYLRAQRYKMETLEEKCLFSQADVTKPYDYAVRFSDLQSLQLLRRKLVTAQAVLESAADVCRRIQDAIPKLLGGRDEAIARLTDVLVAELGDLGSEAQYYQRTVLDLQQRSSDAASLLSGILEHRNGVASEKSLKTMEEISVNAEMERSLEQASATSVRALTIVATLYLPASLLAGIFSTPLVQAEGGPIVVSAEIWKFVVVLLPMMVLTFVLVDLLETFWTNRYDKDRDELRTRQERQQAGLGIPPARRRKSWWNCWERSV